MNCTAKANWNVAVRKANLEGAANTPAEAEAAVNRSAQLAALLSEIDVIRNDRIGGMKADLDALRDHCIRLAGSLAADIAGWEDASEIAGELATRLNATIEQKRKFDLVQQSLEAAQGQHSNAETDLRLLKARLKPLLDIAQVARADQALPLVEAAERRVELQQAIKASQDALLTGGDGLSLDALRAELRERDAEGATKELQAVQQDLEASRKRLTELVEQKVDAERKLASINGSADAATAEGKRQEAMAGMAEAGELHAQFAVSNLLMRWAVDRYRDRKQGPMLKRASTVFRTLTQGAFERLDINFYEKPPVLLALRPDKQSVPVSGLSDGTRDQLFLALRIAALELQIGQGAPFPFIADDLFINFDDDRSKAGLRALFALSKETQVIFLSHHQHLVPALQELFGDEANILTLEGIPAVA